MPQMLAAAETTEPPLRDSQTGSPDTSLGSLMLAAAPLQPTSHVAVYGHRTLPLLLTLSRSGCMEAASVSVHAPPLEDGATTVAWIANLTTEAEVDEAAHRACHSLGKGGRLVVDATAFRKGKGLSLFLQHLAELGLRVIRLMPSSDHLIVVATPPAPFAIVG